MPTTSRSNGNVIKVCTIMTSKLCVTTGEEMKFTSLADCFRALWKVCQCDVYRWNLCHAFRQHSSFWWRIILNHPTATVFPKSCSLQLPTLPKNLGGLRGHHCVSTEGSQQNVSVVRQGSFQRDLQQWQYCCKWMFMFRSAVLWRSLGYTEYVFFLLQSMPDLQELFDLPLFVYSDVEHHEMC